MPLNPRIVSIRTAIGCLFVIAFISWFSGLEPQVCCKRAVMGAVAIYVIATILVRLTNHVLISAFVKFQMRQNGVTSESSN